MSKIRSETKGTLTEIESNVQGIHSRVDEAEYRIGDSAGGEATSNLWMGKDGKGKQSSPPPRKIDTNPRTT